LVWVRGRKRKRRKGTGFSPFPGTLGPQGGGVNMPGVLLRGEGEAEVQPPEQGQGRGRGRGKGRGRGRGTSRGRGRRGRAAATCQGVRWRRGAPKGRVAGDEATSPSSSIGNDYGCRHPAEGGRHLKQESVLQEQKQEQQEEEAQEQQQQQQQQRGGPQQQQGEGQRGERPHRPHHRRRTKGHPLPTQDKNSEWAPLQDSAQHRRQRQLLQFSTPQPPPSPWGCPPWVCPQGATPSMAQGGVLAQGGSGSAGWGCWGWGRGWGRTALCGRGLMSRTCRLRVWRRRTSLCAR